MPDEECRPADSDPLVALAEVDGASGAMVCNTEAPRSFMVALVALVSAILALIHAVPWGVVLSVAALLAPLGIWYYMLVRAWAKPRTVLSHSGKYVGYFLLMGLGMQVARFWEARLWWEIGAKWLLLFVLLYFCMSRMRSAAVKNRLKDANERPV